MKLRIHHPLFAGFVGVVGLLVVGVVVLAKTGLRRELVTLYQGDLERDLTLAQLFVEAREQAQLQQLAIRLRSSIRYRVTLIGADGVVLADSDVAEADVPAMENHGSRPEVRGAMAGSMTFEERESATIGVAFLYGGRVVELNGEPVVLRLAASLAEIDATVGRAQRAVAGAGMLAIVLGLIVSYGLARRLVRPLVDLSVQARLLARGEGKQDPLPTSSVSELAELVDAFNRLTGDLQARMTELAHERDEVRDLLDVLDEGVVALTSEARLLRINRSALEILSIEAVPPLDLAGAFRPRPGAARPHGYVGFACGGAREIRMGDRRVLVSGRPLEAGGAVVTFLDVSEIRRLEEVRSDFVANASHELKTPLTTVRGFSETLLEDDPPEELRRNFLDLIWRNTVRLQQLVDDLLDLSRLESKSWVARPEPVRLDELAARTWSELGPRAEDSGVELSIQGEDWALGDKRGLSQIFHNLFDNALRHTPEGGSIRVGIERRGEEGVVETSVRDTGSGIPLVHLPRIFERFYRADPARSRAEGGTGLGLAIVRHLVQAMGVEVSAESIIEEGTTIRFSLPMCEAPDAPRLARMRATSQGRPTALPSSRTGL